MPPSKRACERCHYLKIKCSLGATSPISPDDDSNSTEDDRRQRQPPCERCVRLKQECTLPEPRKRVDRVAELEAKVDALTRLLEMQGLGEEGRVRAANGGGERDGGEAQEEEMGLPCAGTGAVDTGGEKGVKTQVVMKQKKRKLEEGAGYVAGSLEDCPFNKPQSALLRPREQMEEPPATCLDGIIPLNKQSQILHRYMTEMNAYCPLVPIEGDFRLMTLRQTKPNVLSSILTSTSSGILTVDEQEAATVALVNHLAAAIIGGGERSLELVQALQILCLWFRAPKHHKHVAAFQFVTLAQDVATDVGLAGPNTAIMRAFPGQPDPPESPEAWRTWLVCFLTSSSLAVLVRRPNRGEWTPRHDECIKLILNSPSALATDSMLVNFVRAERLCNRIATELKFAEPRGCCNVADPDIIRIRQSLQEDILMWEALLPNEHRIPTILFYKHVMTLYLNEPVLHTATNKPSFSAPFLAHRLTTAEFPTPFSMTPQHIACLYAIRDATHGLLDLYCPLSTNELMAHPTGLYSGRALYALHLLVKLEIFATIDAGVAEVLDRTELRCAEYIDRLAAVAARIRERDDFMAASRILSHAAEIRLWYDQFSASVPTVIAFDAPATTNNKGFDNGIVSGFGQGDGSGAMFLPMTTGQMQGVGAGMDNTWMDDLWLGDLFAQSGDWGMPMGEAFQF